MNNNDLLKSMKESVGEMDSKFGYSSYKLARYFKEKFPLNYPRLKGLEQNDLTAEDVLYRVTEILLSYERLKSKAIQAIKGKLNSKELRFLIQYFEKEEFRGEIFYKGEDAFRRFLTDFYTTEGKEFSSDINEIEQLRKKILNIGSFAFYFLQVYIVEDLNHLPTDSLLSWYDWFLEPWEYSHWDPELDGSFDDYLYYLESWDEWDEYVTFEEIMEQTKSYRKGKFSKSELRCKLRSN